MKCKALIQKEFKRAKATSVWPETVYGPSEFVGKFPECGGEVTFSVRAMVSDGCGCCGYPEVKITATCSRCKMPYFDGRFSIDSAPTEYLQDLLNNRE